MKLSEMNTDQMLDAYCMVAPAVEVILNGKQVKALSENFRKAQKGETGDWIKFILTQALPVVLKENREAAYVIISAMTEKSVEEVKAQSFVKTIEDIKGFMDQDFLDFLSASEQEVRAE